MSKLETTISGGLWGAVEGAIAGGIAGGVAGGVTGLVFDWYHSRKYLTGTGRACKSTSLESMKNGLVYGWA